MLSKFTRTPLDHAALWQHKGNPSLICNPLTTCTQHIFTMCSAHCCATLWWSVVRMCPACTVDNTNLQPSHNVFSQCAQHVGVQCCDGQLSQCAGHILLTTQICNPLTTCTQHIFTACPAGWCATLWFHIATMCPACKIWWHQYTTLSQRCTYCVFAGNNHTHLPTN